MGTSSSAAFRERLSCHQFISSSQLLLLLLLNTAAKLMLNIGKAEYCYCSTVEY